MGVKERRERQHAAIERLIFGAAEDLLLRFGPGGVSLRAVAERIEYSPAAIYGYFSTKDDLLAALAVHGFRQLNDELTRASEASDSSLLRRLRELYWRYYEFSKTHAAYYELMFLDSSYVVQEGEPRRVILDCADAWRPDLIVVGSRGKNGLDRLLLGSTSEHIARHATCSVEIVRSQTR
jgi:nucleotide-binding universal stress UspA family protein